MWKTKQEDEFVCLLNNYDILRCKWWQKDNIYTARNRISINRNAFIQLSPGRESYMC